MDVFVAIDPDGLGPEPFAEPPGVNPVLLTNIGFAEKIAPHMSRGVLPLANLAWDLTSGRVYLVSTREMPNDSDETDIVLLHSDDDGATWSAPRKVNKDISPTGEVRSQFFPHVAVDQTTGLVAVAWHDPRNDDGGADGIPNTETEVYAAISADGGNYFHELPVSSGVSRASDVPGEIATSHGDYLGVAFHDDNIHVGWVDNSNSAGDNPDAGSPPGCDPLLCMDAYTGRIPLPEPGSAVSLLAGVGLLWGLTMRRWACAGRQSRPTGARLGDSSAGLGCPGRLHPAHGVAEIRRRGGTAFRKLTRDRAGARDMPGGRRRAGNPVAPDSNSPVVLAAQK
jgi:hypothetical protein